MQKPMFRGILLGISCLAASRAAEAKMTPRGDARDTTPIIEVTGAKCPKIAEKGTFRCFEQKYALVFARDTVGLAAVLNDVQLAAEHFTEYFGKEPGRGALVLTDPKTDSIKKLRTGNVPSAQGNLEVSPQTIKILLGLKYHWVMAFAPRDAFRAMLAKQFATQIPDPSMIDGVVDGMMPMYSGLLSHELGHSWYISGYWPENYEKNVAHPDITKEYGGPAPDWLDECAAIVLEDTVLKTQRRELVRSTYQKDPNSPALLSFDTLFAMIHPFGGKGNEGNVDMFYAENRVLIDFLLPHSKPDRPIFGSITQGVLKGQTMAQWLRESGPEYGLPTTVAELNTQWREWVANH